MVDLGQKRWTSVHLFYFRKHKTIYFSSIRFLKEIKEEKAVFHDSNSLVMRLVSDIADMTNQSYIEDFTEQPKVINGASDLIASIFGDAGMHTRAAVSANSLPLGVSVEVDAIFELN